MALKQQSAKSKSSLETSGPAMADVGGMPPNPSDQIFQGRALVTRPPESVTLRRSFSIPVKPTLHYRDGLDGAAETVTVNERRLCTDEPEEYVDDVADLKYPPTQSEDWDHGEFGASSGGREGSADGPNDAYTTNGVLIRGT